MTMIAFGRPSFGVGELTHGKGVRVLNSFSPSKQALEGETKDLDWLLIGDSTSTASSTSHPKFFADLAASYPAYTFKMRSWSTGTGDYGALTTLQTGTGSRTITLHNASSLGAGYLTRFGADYAKAIAAIASVDLVIFNCLKNDIIGTTEQIVRSNMISDIEDLRARWPNANFAVTAQFPNRDDTNLDAILANGLGTYSTAAQMMRREVTFQPDLLVIDLYTPFVSKPSSLYADSLHFNSTGYAECAAVIRRLWDASRPGDFAPSAPFMGKTAAEIGASSLLLNSDLSLGATLPTNWIANGAVSSEQDAVIKTLGAAYSRKLTGGASAQPRISQNISAGNLTLAKANGRVTLAALIYIPTGAASSVGRPNVSPTGSGGGFTPAQSGVGRWMWRFVADVPVLSGTSAITAQVSQDTAAAGAVDTTHPINVQHISMVTGSVPALGTT